MKLRKIYLAAAVPAMMMALASCSDDKDYKPGEPDAPDCMGVYFDSANATEFMFIPGDNTQIPLKMHRLRAEAEADVPLLVRCSVEGIAVPESVHFAAGEKDAEVVVDFSAMPPKVAATLKIDVPSEYVSIYSDKLCDYQATALASAWESANTDGSPVKFYFTSVDYTNYSNPNPVSAVYQPIESPVWILPGGKKIWIENFLGSDCDMTFTLSESPYSGYTGSYRVSPLTNYITMADVYASASFGDAWYNAWFFYDESIPDDEGFFELELTRLDGVASSLDYPICYWYSDSYQYEYSVAVVKSDSHKVNAISIGFTGTPLDNDVSLPDYFFIYFKWDGESSL